MQESQKGYRAFPPVIEHPSNSKLIGKWKFKFTKKSKMEEAPSICEGHEGTIIWYADKIGYLLEIRFKDHPTVYTQSICTFTPTMGMDKIDGSFAEDVEAYFLEETLGYKPDRLDIFGGKKSVEINKYLKARGFIE